MSVTLTCECGARFDLDAPIAHAGREAPCPDCGKRIRLPSAATALPRISWVALVGVFVAAAGAFNPVAGAGAILLGLFAHLVILRSDGRLAGGMFANAAIALGLVGAVLGVSASYAGDRFRFDGFLREWLLTGQLDPISGKQIASSDGDLTLTIDPAVWRKVRNNKTDDPGIGDLQAADRNKVEWLLFNPHRNVYLDLRRITGPALDLGGVIHGQVDRGRGPLIGNDDDGMNPMASRNHLGGQTSVHFRDRSDKDNVQREDWAAVLMRGPNRWQFLIRTQRRSGEKVGKGANSLWMIRAYGSARNVAASETELRAILDSASLNRP